jgi:hypothetical protein
MIAFVGPSSLTGFKPMPHIYAAGKGVLFRGAYLPQKLDPKSDIETQYKLFQAYVLSYQVKTCP